MLIGTGADILRIQSATEKRGKRARAVRWRKKERSRKTEKIRQDKQRRDKKEDKKITDEEIETGGLDKEGKCTQEIKYYK